MLVTDQLGRQVELLQSPKRIVSLVPSQTELLHDLGLEEEVVGITKFCIHPHQWFRTKARVGGTKQVDFQKIKDLQPDLIIANKEENIESQVMELAKYFPVWVSDVNTLDEAMEMITSVGSLVGRQEKAGELVHALKASFGSIPISEKKGLKTCYLIWKDPFMTVGGDTFIHDMLSHAGFTNLFADSNRYPEVTIKELQIMKCEVLLLSSEPYPFGPKHVEELKALLPGTKIVLVDGELFSWYGSRLLHSPAYFEQLGQQIDSIS